jgi:hypothetical protein
MRHLFILLFLTSCISQQQTEESRGITNIPVETKPAENGAIDENKGDLGPGPIDAPEEVQQPDTSGSLGRASLIGEVNCAGDAECLELSIECGDLEPIGVTLKIHGAELENSKGMGLFFSGMGGTSSWLAGNGQGKKMDIFVFEHDFMAIEVMWESSWIVGDDLSDGMRATSCRGATLIDWVARYKKTEDQKMCLIGQSGGAAHVATSLGEYPISQYIDAAIMTAGPGNTDLKSGCHQGINPALYLGNLTAVIDTAFGFAPSTGPCSNPVGIRDDFWGEHSLNGGWYPSSFPTTHLALIQGELDGPTREQGRVFYELMEQSGQQSIEWQQLPGVRHNVGAFDTGFEAIVNTLKSHCL